MKYRASADLDFELGGTEYLVPRGDVVEIPDRWHPWVISRGLLLEVVNETQSGERSGEAESVQQGVRKSQSRSSRGSKPGLAGG